MAYRIMIVEDEAVTRLGLVLTTPWGEWDTEIIGEASNGKEGLELAQRLKPDIIITDIKMPIMDGIEMMESIAMIQDCVFVVLSAHSEFEYAKRALQLGAIDYLLKPFSDEMLYEAIKNAKENVNNLRVLNKERHVTRNDIKQTFIRYLSKSARSQHENILKTLQYIRDHYAEDINITSVSEYLNVSESYLTRLFRKETSYSFHEYLTVFRMQRACELLEDANIRIYEVAEQTGYRDQRYFSIVFKKYLGMTPRHYQEQF